MGDASLLPSLARVCLLLVAVLMSSHAPDHGAPPPEPTPSVLITPVSTRFAPPPPSTAPPADRTAPTPGSTAAPAPLLPRAPTVEPAPPSAVARSIVAGEPGCNRIAFIFNIGIGDAPATTILDTLENERVPATMFVMGWWAEQNSSLLQRLVNEGYPIGSHGYARTELTTLSDDEVRRDLRAAAVAIERAAGIAPARLFTPYAAAIDDRVRALIAAEGYLVVGWEVAAADYGPDATEESVYERIMRGVYDGAIVELHLDGPASDESTGQALPRLIQDLRAAGYRFVTIPEMAEPCP